MSLTQQPKPSGRSGRRHRKILPHGLYIRNGVFQLSFQRNGRRVRKSLATADLAEAIEQRRLELLKSPTPKGEGLLRTAQLHTEEQLRLANLQPRSARELMRLLADVLRFTQASSLDDLTPAKLQTYFNRITAPRAQGGLSPASWSSYAGRLSGFFRDMVQKHRLTKNPMDQVRLPRFNQAAHARSTTLDQQTANRLIQNCADQRVKFALLCGFHAGMRKEEIIEARWGWFDLTARVANIPMTERKIQKPAYPPLTSSMIEHLGKMRRALPQPPAPTDYVLEPAKQSGRHRYRWDFRIPFENYLHQQGVKFTAHDMRRSYCTNNIKNGVSLEMLSSWTGDAMRTLEQHYKHLMAYDPRVEKLAG
jgi:integrase